MDRVVNYYLYGSILVAIIFFIFTSTLFYWVINRFSQTVGGPALYSYKNGGPTVAGRFVMAILIFALFFGVIDYLYSSLNGDDNV